MQLKKKWLTITDRDGITTLDLGAMEIWDGADMALLRETLTELIEDVGVRMVGIDLQYVKYIPSGFFDMMYDWHEKQDVTVHLFSPQPNVLNMLWFQRFLQPLDDECYLLQSEPSVVINEQDEEEELPVEESSWGYEVYSAAFQK